MKPPAFPVLFRSLATGAILVLGAALSACSPVTAEHYEKIETGMSREEVHALLGRPDTVDGGGVGSLELSREVWKGREAVIRITFAGDRVTLKSISSLDEGDTPAAEEP